MDQEFPFDHFFSFSSKKQEQTMLPLDLEDESNEISEVSKDLEVQNESPKKDDTKSVATEIEDSISPVLQESPNVENRDTISPLNQEDKDMAMILEEQSPENKSLSPADYDEEYLLIESGILELLQTVIPPQKFTVYFQNNFKLVNMTEDLLCFQVKTRLIKTIIEKNYLKQLDSSIQNILGRPYSITFTVNASQTVPLDPPADDVVEDPISAEELDDSNISSNSHPINTISTQDYNQNELSDHDKIKENKKSRSAKDVRFNVDLVPSQNDLMAKVDTKVINHLNPGHHGQNIDTRKTFDNFVVGPSNNIAYASALAISKNPGNVYPSLYLHSHSGLGKTHLLHSVANNIRDSFPHMKIFITSARDFMTEMIDAMANKKIAEFRKKYSEQIDVLMIDDIHELKNKPGTQNEFFHVFNELYNKGKQLIFTSDRPPKEIDGLEERIKTRLSWGLVLDIQKPDIETRIAILKNKANQEDIYITNEVVNLIAQNMTDSIRELEGSLIRLAAYASVMQVDVDIDIAKEQLKLNKKDTHKLSTERIIDNVSNFFKIPAADITSKIRHKQVTEARHMAMYLAYKHLPKTFAQIGVSFGNRDHSSVVHAVEKIKKQLLQKPELKHIISDLEKSLDTSDTKRPPQRSS